jgi:hypothetical protein
MSELKITHSAAEGTLLAGTSRGDGVWDTIKAAQASYKIRGWKWFRSLGMFGVSYSRDKAPQLGLIDRTAEILREAGHTVTIEVDTAPRAMEEAEADRAEHMDERAYALNAKAGRKNAAADARHAAAQHIADGIPMGQPILVGHHSEKRHRADMRRIDSGMRAAIALEAEATTAAGRAASAEKHMQHREDPRRVARRIETLEAERRGVQRSIDGNTTRHLDGQGVPVYVFEHPPATGRHLEQCVARAADLDEKIRYWKAFLAEEVKEGRYNPVDLSVIKPGDLVRYWGGWRKVVKVNKVTISVESGYSWADKVKVVDVLGHQPAPAVEESVDLDAVQETTS